MSVRAIAFLYGHMMKNTDHHRAFEKNNEALCVFSGAHTYVSPRWYSNPQTGSSWNYISLYARGKILFLSEPELLKILSKLRRGSRLTKIRPLSSIVCPSAHVASLKNAIIAFE